MNYQKLMEAITGALILAIDRGEPVVIHRAVKNGIESFDWFAGECADPPADQDCIIAVFPNGQAETWLRFQYGGYESVEVIAK